MDLFTRSAPDRHARRRVKQWAAELLDLGPNDSVVASELSCTEPGCPPRETVVLVAREGEPTIQLKVHKAIDDVSRADLEAAIDPTGASPT